MGVILFMVCSAFVGGRLLRLYAQLRQLPELFLGVGYILAGLLGWGGLLIGAITTPPGQHLPEGYQAWSVVVGNAGTVFFYLFAWYVFRRNSVIAMSAVALVTLVFLVSVVRDTLLLGVTFGPPPGTLTTFAGALGRAAVFPWLAAEAFISYAAFRRRARIGLGNPIVANRLLLWGISAMSSFVLSTTAILLYVTAPDSVAATVRQNEAGGLYGLCAFVSAVANWLAFFPPQRYTRWVTAGSEEFADD